MPGAPSTRNVIVVTGTRAEFGLLLPVMREIDAHPALTLHVIATGTHLLQSGLTYREVKAAFPHAIAVPMQIDGRRTRADDAEATGNGIARLSRVFAHNDPDWVVVLGDRIEAFAAASAASIGGWAVAHVHGGDRAEGIADEAMRHAITKLSHLHCAATAQSAERIVKMGERPEFVHCVGSPAIDALAGVTALPDDEARGLADGNDWQSIILLHPAGLDEATERAWARAAVDGCSHAGPALVLSPNHDAGRDWIVNELDAACEAHNWPRLDHLPRDMFLRALKRLAHTKQPLVGNSSAGLIEAAALGVPVVNLGPRQAGRERAGAMVDVETPDATSITTAITRAQELAASDRNCAHPYGDCTTGAKIAALLASVDPRSPNLLRKRNAY